MIRESLTSAQKLTEASLF